MTASYLGIEYTPVNINLWGDGLLADPSLNVKDQNGVNIAFTVVSAQPHQIILNNFTPALVPNTFYTVYYGTRPLIQALYEEPKIELGGIYYIDSKRNRMADLYNNISKQIPDPTIRTALIGD
jgi:hypothetical protein